MERGRAVLLVVVALATVAATPAGPRDGADASAGGARLAVHAGLALVPHDTSDAPVADAVPATELDLAPPLVPAAPAPDAGTPGVDAAPASDGPRDDSIRSMSSDASDASAPTLAPDATSASESGSPPDAPPEGGAAPATGTAGEISEDAQPVEAPDASVPDENPPDPEPAGWLHLRMWLHARWTAP